MKVIGRKKASRFLPHLAAAVALSLLGPVASLAPYAGQPVASAQGNNASVQMKDFKYIAETVNIPVGGTVEWTQLDTEPHNVAITEGPELNVSPEVRLNQKWAMKFTKPGRYEYYCEFHPGMKGRVIVGGSNSAAPAKIAQTFAETGKTARGAFYEYWERSGGLPQQGFAISEEMQEKSDTDGKVYRVQYFERAVFEMHPENAPPNDLLLSLLGNFEYKRKYPSGAPNQKISTDNPRKFAETGKTVGGKFRAYWEKNGGLAQQGFPISEEFQEKNDLDGKTYTVQYFERAVFESHPENAPPYDVLLSQLGKFRYDRVAPKPGAPNALGIRSIGMSSGPQSYPLLAGPHAAPGMNVFIYDQKPMEAQVTTLMNDLGTKWALHQLSWYQMETEGQGKFNWQKLDSAVETLSKAGYSIILHPVHSPPWSWEKGVTRITYPANPANFGKFMTEVAKRYKGKVAGYQIWNEPNLTIESGQYVVAARYAEILKTGYIAVKAVDPTAVIITAALTPTGVNDPNKAVDDVIFLKRLYAYNGGEFRNYFDVLGAHPGSNANPPDTLSPEKPGPGPGWNTHPSFYFRRIEQIRQVMVENGDADKQMWLTEFGWTSVEKPAPGFEYAAQNSEEEQAQYIGQAYRMGRDKYAWMGPMLLFQLNFALPSITTDPGDERIGWGIIRRDGSKRPSYFAVQQYAKEYNAKK